MALAQKSSDFRNIMDAAKQQGWSVEATKNQHWKFTPPKGMGGSVFFSGSPGDWRSIKNFISMMRKNGFSFKK